MNPGSLDREITLKTAVQTQDPDSGEVLIDWDSLDEILMAQWLPGNTRESYFAQQRLASHVTGIFRVPPIDRPNPATQRIVDEEGVTYDLMPAIEIGRGDGWEIPVVARGEP